MFPDPYSVMENTACVTDWMRNRLAEEGKCSERCVPAFLQTEEGDYLYRTREGEFWRCSKLIEGATAHVHVTDPQLLYNAGKGYGEFVRLTDGYPAGTLAEVLPDFHNTKKRFAAFLEAVEKDVEGRAHEVEKEITFLKEREELAGSIVAMLESGELPLRVTHNDTKLSNVLLDDDEYRDLMQRIPNADDYIQRLSRRLIGGDFKCESAYVAIVDCYRKEISRRVG